MDLERLSEEELIRLLQLPNSLRKTMMAVLELGEAPAGEVAEKTGRLRSSESGYLNRLERMGLVKRRRKGRPVHFFSQNMRKSEEKSDRSENLT